MSFLTFFLYITICILIYGIIGVLIYKFYFKKRSLSNFDKLLDNIFNDDEDFDSSIHEIDNTKDFLKRVR